MQCSIKNYIDKRGLLAYPGKDLRAFLGGGENCSIPGNLCQGGLEGKKLLKPKNDGDVLVRQQSEWRKEKWLI